MDERRTGPTGSSKRTRRALGRRRLRLGVAGLLAAAMASAVGVLGVGGLPQAGATSPAPVAQPTGGAIIGAMFCYSIPQPVYHLHSSTPTASQLTTEGYRIGCVSHGVPVTDVTITSTPRVCRLTVPSTGSGTRVPSVVFTAPGTCSWTIRSGTDAYSQSTLVVTTAAPAPAATRVYGETATATAAAELEHAFPPASGNCVGPSASGRTVLLATDAHFPDALSGAYLAGQLETGLLLTTPAALPPSTIAALKAEGVAKVVVLGGPLAVATSVVSALERLPVYSCGGTSTTGATLSVTRIYGQTQYGTAEHIAEDLPPADISGLSFPAAYGAPNAAGGSGLYNDTAGSGSGKPASTTAQRTAIVASGAEFQDSMAAGAIAWASHVPILLTTPSALSPDAASAIGTLGITQAIVVGGPLAVSNAVVSSLEQLGVSVVRIAGETYMGTSTEIAKFETAGAGAGLGWSGTGNLVVARGNGFTDGLAGADVAGTAREPLVLTASPTTPGNALVVFCQEAGTTGLGGVKVGSFTVLGGPLAVTQTVLDALGQNLGVPPLRS